MVGKMLIWLAVWSFTRGRNSLRKASDSLGVLYIFQLAAIRGLRMCGTVFHGASDVGRPEVAGMVQAMVLRLVIDVRHYKEKTVLMAGRSFLQRCQEVLPVCSSYRVMNLRRSAPAAASTPVPSRTKEPGSGVTPVVPVPTP